MLWWDLANFYVNVSIYPNSKIARSLSAVHSTKQTLEELKFLLFQEYDGFYTEATSRYCNLERIILSKVI